MSSWAVEDWFVKWLEMARIEMSSTESSPLAQETDAELPLCCSQLPATEEHKMAA